jgi:hypothetical protein
LWTVCKGSEYLLLDNTKEETVDNCIDTQEKGQRRWYCRRSTYVCDGTAQSARCRLRPLYLWTCYAARPCIYSRYATLSQTLLDVTIIPNHILTNLLLTNPVTPVFWFTSPALGGYGLTPIQLSIFFGAVGISQAFWLLVVFPPLQVRFTTRGVLKGCYIAWPIFFAAAPMGNWFLRKGWTTTFWIVAPVLGVAGSAVAMAFSMLISLFLNFVLSSFQKIYRSIS